MNKLTIRPAERRDITAIVALFADDVLGGHGDTTDMLHVAELDDEIVGTFHTTLITTMSGRGSSSMTIAAVQTRSDL